MAGIKDLHRQVEDGTEMQGGTQHIICTRLVVKGEDRAAALKTVEDNLMDWFHETGPEHVVPGYGYPNGSLLHYTIED